MTRWADFRRTLHARPECSGRETHTAAAVADALHALAPDRVLTGLGGHGVAALFRFGRPPHDPALLLRAELDALPIHEQTRAPHASRTPGVMHACGHDGHTASLLAALDRLSDEPPPRPVLALFQPAEETGEGAAAVLADARFQALYRHADRCVALHNLPGFPLAAVVLAEGVFASASVGRAFVLRGRATHAAHPGDGLSPLPALVGLARRLCEQPALTGEPGAIATLTHLGAGEPGAFGVSPGEARLHVTLRAPTDDALADLDAEVLALVEHAARRDGLAFDPATDRTAHDAFPAARAHPGAAGIVRRAARSIGLDLIERDRPFAWSEDFGRFTTPGRTEAGADRWGVLFGLGAGEAHPQLHHPSYDFPDALIDPAADLLAAIARSDG